MRGLGITHLCDSWDPSLKGFESMSVQDEQQGGNHYKDGIQPTDYAHANKLDCYQFSCVKHVTRVGKKGSQADAILDHKKAIHYIQMRLEKVYGIESKITYDDQPEETVNE